MSDTEKRFQLRISEALYEKLEAWSTEEYRSVNAQIVKILSEAVARREREAARKRDEDEIVTPELEGAFVGAGV